jgi:hypothetical protein
LNVRLEEACIEAELDEQWSWVGNKSNQRWLWHAVDHATHTIFTHDYRFNPLPFIDELAEAQTQAQAIILDNLVQKNDSLEPNCRPPEPATAKNASAD